MNQGAWDALKELVPMFAVVRPNVGRLVTVVQGKHTDKIGKIFWHGLDRFKSPYRYCEEMQRHLIDVRGTYGFRVGIETQDGEKFFVPAEYVAIYEPFNRS